MHGERKRKEGLKIEERMEEWRTEEGCWKKKEWNMVLSSKYALF